VSKKATVKKPSDEAATFWHKFQEAQQAGLDEDDAAAFAKVGDVSELRKLVAAKCPLELIRAIVL
jgi:hypothetical protein